MILPVSLLRLACRSLPGCPQLSRPMSGCDYHFAREPASLSRPVGSFAAETLGRFRALRDYGVVDPAAAGGTTCASFA